MGYILHTFSKVEWSPTVFLAGVHIFTKQDYIVKIVCIVFRDTVDTVQPASRDFGGG